MTVGDLIKKLSEQDSKLEVQVWSLGGEYPRSLPIKDLTVWRGVTGYEWVGIDLEPRAAEASAGSEPPPAADKDDGGQDSTATEPTPAMAALAHDARKALEKLVEGYSAPAAVRDANIHPAQELAAGVQKACEQLEFESTHPHGQGSVETLKARIGATARDLRAALEKVASRG